MVKKFEQYVIENIQIVNQYLLQFITSKFGFPFQFVLDTRQPPHKRDKYNKLMYDDNVEPIYDFTEGTDEFHSYYDTYKIHLTIKGNSIGYTVIIIENFNLVDNRNDPAIITRPDTYKLFIDQTIIIYDGYKNQKLSRLFTYLHVSLVYNLGINSIVKVDIISWDQIRKDNPLISRYVKYGFNELENHHIKNDDEETADINNILFFENAPKAFTELQKSIIALFSEEFSARERGEIHQLARELEHYSQGMGNPKYNYYSKYLQFKTKYIILKNLISKN